MSYQFLDLTVQENVGTVTMNRPPGNAISMDLIEEFDGMLSEISENEAIRCLVVKSALPKQFMVGADLTSLVAGVDLESIDMSGPLKETMRQIVPVISDPIEEFLSRGQEMLNRMESLPIPTIVAIGGNALGGGLEFSLACDFRIMARGKPKIGLSELDLGLIPGGGGTQRLPKVVGRAKALEMILLARRLDADEAESLGLVTEAVEPDQLDEAVAELSRRLASGATVAIGYAKAALLGGEQKGLQEGLDLERQGIAGLLETEDTAEGFSAFTEKRPPEFKGK